MQNTDSSLLVYQVGKVGSSSIAGALSRVSGLTVHQIHRLNPNNIARVRSAHEQRGWGWPPGDKEGEEVYERLIRPRVPLRIVTLVREPIGRNISYYFQNLHKIWKSPNAHESISIEALVRGFQIEFPYSDDPLHWFDYEFREVLGIDVFQQPFDHVLGMRKIVNETYEVLILSSDLPDGEKVDALNRFLNLSEPLTFIQPANVTADKSQATAYRNFLYSIRMLPEYVDMMLESKFSRHFFAPTKLQEFRSDYLMGGHIVPDAFCERWGRG